MALGAFSHTLFFKHPLESIAFFSLGMSLVSFWIRKTPWLWGAFLLIAYVAALNTGIAHWITLIPTAGLFFCHLFLTKQIQRTTRFFLFCIATTLSCGLWLHLIPGFHNWNLVHQIHLTPIDAPYSLWLNFDKPFIALFALGLSIPLLSSKEQLKKMLKVALPMTLLAIVLLTSLSVYFNLVKFEPKLPTILFVWLINNLVFVCITEEAFFRGFIQKELIDWFGNTNSAVAIGIFFSALGFALLHLPWTTNLPFVGMIFLGGLFYGAIYQITRSIEASILCHFSVNLVQFLFFSYPALA